MDSLDEENPIISLESNYINTTNSTEDAVPSKNSTNSFGYFHRTGSGGGLKAGAIVGIILASLAAIAAIIAVWVCFNKRGPERGIKNESINNLKVNSSNLENSANITNSPVVQYAN